MGNSVSAKKDLEQDAREFELPSEFGLITEDGLPLNKVTNTCFFPHHFFSRKLE